MTDRELLELAAKAAGLYDEWPKPDYEVQVYDDYVWCSGMGKSAKWAPLADDGDALRLAVALKITLHIDSNLTDAESTAGFATEAHGTDPCAATRRAIVRAAAEIWRAKERT